ncbi:hypothetical protein [Tychonema sp. LEGE 06208]|uniref:hypothetical protein n=1 Tax=Tychonema sp. LEGE 06208 TaxID=1828663 RepID=UPI001880ACFC|nr:hypothetical protein [Tychonema sp. LEGE 06208]MBE9161428.1 hypothetical protein [Tychonema sp. LEGE 06208]
MQENDFEPDLRIDTKETGFGPDLLAATKDFDEKPGFKSRRCSRLLMIFDRPTRS